MSNRKPPIKTINQLLLSKYDSVSDCYSMTQNDARLLQEQLLPSKDKQEDGITNRVTCMTMKEFFESPTHRWESYKSKDSCSLRHQPSSLTSRNCKVTTSITNLKEARRTFKQYLNCKPVHIIFHSPEKFSAEMASSVLVWLTTLLLSTLVYAGLEDCSHLPAPHNGNVQMVFSKSDQLLAIYTCNEGYAVVGETVLSCANGNWNKIPPFCATLEECELNVDTQVDNSQRSCPTLPSPRFGRMDTSLADSLESTATFNCFKGYYLQGPDTLYCKNGRWDGQVPECKPVDCGEPEAPAHGTVEFEDTHFLSKAHYKCDACYVLNGFNKRSCKPSRQWSKSVPECVLLTDVCSLPDLELPEGAFVPNEDGLLENGIACGQKVQIQCLSGDQVEATCNSDGVYSWSGTCRQEN